MGGVFTVVGYDLVLAQASIKVVEAENWVAAARLRYLDYGEEGHPHQQQFQLCCVFAGRQEPAITVEGLPFGPPEYKPRNRVVDTFTVVGWNGAAQDGVADAVEGPDAASCALAVWNMYDSQALNGEVAPFYQVVCAFRGIVPPGPLGSEWTYARYLRLKAEAIGEAAARPRARLAAG